MSSQPNNHLFIQWLKEWSDNFIKLGTKSAKTYKKAYESLTASPRPFQHPSELMQLKFIGEKICQQLEKRLKEHCVANGLAMPLCGSIEDRVLGSLEISRALEAESASQSTARNPPMQKKAKNSKGQKLSRNSAPASVASVADLILENPPTKRMANKRKENTLRDDPSRPTTAMKANTWSAGAEPEAEPEPPAKKGRKYVPRFRSGAYAILLALFKNDCFEEPFTKSEIIKHAEPLCDKPFESQTNVGQFYSAWGSMKTLINNGLVYERGRPSLYYITQEGKDVAEKILQVENASKEQNNENTSSVNSFNISDNNLPCSTITSTETNSSTRTLINWPSESILPRTTRQTSDFNSPPSITQDLSTPSLSNMPISDPAQDSVKSYGEPNILESVGNEIRRLRSTTVPISEQSIEEITNNLITWPPGSFEISMILDNREIKSREQSDFFSDRLRENGADNTTRALAVGDFIWIATNKSTGEEAILDFIVERKRIDDLKSSILDGRFREQKFRLKRSSVTNVIYLVEEPPGLRIEGMEQAIQTSLSETIMVHDFFLIRTASLDESIKYLTKITQQLKIHYSNKGLTIIPARMIGEVSDYMKLVSDLREANPSLDISINYETFSALLSKGGLKTIRDVYIKMLMCVKGVTFEKAVEIQKIYPTPRHLIDAYEEISDINARRLLLFDKLGTGITVKKVTKLLSEKIYQMWCGL